METNIIYYIICWIKADCPLRGLWFPRFSAITEFGLPLPATLISVWCTWNRSTISDFVRVHAKIMFNNKTMLLGAKTHLEQLHSLQRPKYEHCDVYSVTEIYRVCCRVFSVATLQFWILYFGLLNYVSLKF